MEDAHICSTDFDKNNGACLFAIFDGHGGIEAAKFCERNFIPCLLKNANY
jgi:serine/threonine protein phosphatase PrpC